MSCHSYRSYHQFVINVMYTNFKNYLLLQVVILNIPIGGKTNFTVAKSMGINIIISNHIQVPVGVVYSQQERRQHMGVSMNLATQ